MRRLKDELRSKVMVSHRRDLDDVIDIATHFEEDWDRSFGIGKKHGFFKPRLKVNQFKRIHSDRVKLGEKFKKQRSSPPKKDDACFKCHRQHLGKQCY
uniref:Uncharacterized protein n=1 Tax=Nymphaea colorata TaxID=210225 RepID=A0A5K1FBD3_9MAGN|nr:unnamed protein product [Nymphaea colorata]